MADNQAHKSARAVHDDHTCPCHAPAAHVGGPIDPPGSTSVEVDGLHQARATDKLTCTGAPTKKNYIVTGSSTVEINGLLAARMTDRTMHQPAGKIFEGSAHLEIGGPTAGVTLGGKGATAACLAMKNTRTSGLVHQSYSNCALESSRMLINQANGSSVTENQLFNESLDNGLAKKVTDSSGNLDSHASGGSWNALTILNNHGVSATAEDVSMDNIAQGVADGKGVITVHDAGQLWGTTDTGLHAINVTGMTYDADGKPSQVIMNDTGLGKCGRKMPASDFDHSLDKTDAVAKVVITTNPVWK